MRIEQLLPSKENLEKLAEFVKAWRAEGSFRESFGLKPYNLTILNDLVDLAWSDTYSFGSTLFVLFDEQENIVGVLGLFVVKSSIGHELMANEHYWYVLKDHRKGRLAIGLINKAREWAKEKLCTHFLMNASMMISEDHDQVCELYQRIGMKKFETTYIQEI